MGGLHSRLEITPGCPQGLEPAFLLSLQEAGQLVLPSTAVASVPPWLDGCSSLLSSLWPSALRPLSMHDAYWPQCCVNPNAKSHANQLSPVPLLYDASSALRRTGWGPGTPSGLSPQHRPLSSYQERPPLALYKVRKDKDSPWPQ